MFFKYLLIFIVLIGCQSKDLSEKLDSGPTHCPPIERLISSSWQIYKNGTSYYLKIYPDLEKLDTWVSSNDDRCRIDKFELMAVKDREFYIFSYERPILVSNVTRLQNQPEQILNLFFTTTPSDSDYISLCFQATSNLGEQSLWACDYKTFSSKIDITPGGSTSGGSTTGGSTTGGSTTGGSTTGGSTTGGSTTGGSTTGGSTTGGSTTGGSTTYVLTMKYDIRKTYPNSSACTNGQSMTCTIQRSVTGSKKSELEYKYSSCKWTQNNSVSFVIDCSGNCTSQFGGYCSNGTMLYSVACGGVPSTTSYTCGWNP